jgi:hypothetical protein
MVGECRRANSKKWRVLVYFVALSTTQSNKSVSYPKVTWIVFDEFIIEKGMLRYIPNEVEVFDQFFITVDRFKDKTRVLFAANSVSIENPYFVAWDIDPDGEEFRILKGGFIGVQFVNSEAFAKRVSQTRMGRYIQGSEYAKFALDNQFSDNTKELIGEKTPNAIYLFTLVTKNFKISIWHDGDTGIFYAQQKQPKNCLYGTLIPSKIDSDVIMFLKNDKMISKLRTAMRRAKLLSDSAQTRNEMRVIFT